MKRIPVVSAFTIAVLCGGWRVAATSHSSAPEMKSLVFISGNDTVGRESFTRSGDSLKGDLLLGKKHMHYEGQISSTGAISRLDVQTSGTGTANERLTSVIIGRDSARLIEHLGTNVDTIRFASAPGLLPFINPSMALSEFIIEGARAQKSEPARVPILSVDEGAVGSIEVSFVTPDSAAIGFANAPKPMRASIDAQGHIRGGTLGPRRIAILPTFVALPPGK